MASDSPAAGAPASPDSAPPEHDIEAAQAASVEFQIRATRQSTAERYHTKAYNAEELELEDVSCWKRFKLLFKPIYEISTIDAHTPDSKTHIVIVPESFRMLFYASFLSFLALANAITGSSGNLDLEDNLILDRFGTNNMCIYFDEKPFIYISSFLYIFLLELLLLYEFTEWYRVYDSYRDDKLMTKGWYSLFVACTMFEIFAFIFFVQVFAVRPKDNIIVHTIPYYVFVLALWSMSFKKAMYVHKLRILRDPILKTGLKVYIGAMLATVVGKIIIGAPNLFGAKLWEQDGYEWTPTFSNVNGNIYLVLTLPAPVIMYFFVIDKLDKLHIVINRDRIRLIKTKSDDSQA